MRIAVSLFHGSEIHKHPLVETHVGPAVSDAVIHNTPSVIRMTGFEVRYNERLISGDQVGSIGDESCLARRRSAVYTRYERRQLMSYQ